MIATPTQVDMIYKHRKETTIYEGEYTGGQTCDLLGVPSEASNHAIVFAVIYLPSVISSCGVDNVLFAKLHIQCQNAALQLKSLRHCARKRGTLAMLYS